MPAAPEGPPESLKETKLAPGSDELIDGYQVAEVLGKGGMGSVYRAWHGRLGIWVALKVLKPELSADDSFVQRFLGEARTTGKLRHGNIVSAMDCGESDGRYFLVMEFIEGKPLDEVLRARGGRLPEETALEIVRQVAEGLEYARQNNVIHRDIKPQNIMITTDGQAKICDLGLSRDTTSDLRLTQTGSIACTPAYASPEQAQGESDVDTRSDIYSLGITFYEMLTGETPFEAETAMKMLMEQVKRPPVPPKRKNPRISRDTSNLVMWMLEKKRFRRPETPGVVAEEAAALINRPPGEERERSRERPSERGARSRFDHEAAGTSDSKKPLVAAIAGGAVVLLIVIFALVGGGGAEDAPAAVNGGEEAGASAEIEADLDRIESEADSVSNVGHAEMLIEELDELSSEAGVGTASGRIDRIRSSLEERIARLEKEAAALAAVSDAAEYGETHPRDYDETVMRFERAIATLKEVLPDDVPAAHRRQAEFERKYNELAEEAYTAIYDDVQEFLANDEYEKALARLEAYPEDLKESQYWTVEIPRLRKEIETAKGSSDRVIEHVRRGNELVQEEKLAQAVKEFTRALAINPRHTLALNNRGVCHVRAGNYRQALADFSRALELGRREAGTWYNRGVAEYQLKQYRSAVRSFRKALDVAEPGWESRMRTEMMIQKIRDEHLEDR